MSAQEKRLLSRFELELPIFVRVPGTLRLVEAQTKDLSASGVFFYISLKLVEGAEIEFTVVLPPELTHSAAIPLSCKGKILRVQQDTEERVGIAAAIYSFKCLAAAGATIY